MDLGAIGATVRGSSSGNSSGNKQTTNNTNFLPDVRKRISQQMEIHQGVDELSSVNVVPSIETAMKHYDDMPLLGTLAKIQSHVEAIHAELADIDAQIQMALQPPVSHTEQETLTGLDADGVSSATATATTVTSTDDVKVGGSTFVTEVDIVTDSPATAATGSNKSKKAAAAAAPSKKPNVVMSVKDVRYPGFDASKPEPLPANTNTKQVLLGVCNGVHLERDSDSAAWKQLMLSPESQAFVQDTFWWWFCDEFQPECAEDQQKLFDRLSERFVSLFLAAPRRLKDEVITRFHDVVSQSVFCAFFVAFPNSRAKFDEKFKMRLSRNLAHWCTGAGLKQGHEASHWSGRLNQALSDLQTTRAVNEDVENAGADAAVLVGNMSLSPLAGGNLTAAAAAAAQQQHKKHKKDGKPKPMVAFASGMANSFRKGFSRDGSNLGGGGGMLARGNSTADIGANSIDMFLKEALDHLSGPGASNSSVNNASISGGGGKGRPMSRSMTSTMMLSPKMSGRFSMGSMTVDDATAASSRGDDDNMSKSHQTDTTGGGNNNKKGPATLTTFVPPLRLPAMPQDEISAPTSVSARQRLTQRTHSHRSGAMTERAHTRTGEKQQNGAMTERSNKKRRSIRSAPVTSRDGIASPQNNNNNNNNNAKREEVEDDGRSHNNDNESTTTTTTNNNNNNNNNSNDGSLTARGSDVVKFNLMSNSPLIRHWLAKHSKNDTRVLQFTKIIRGGVALQMDSNEHFYQQKIQGSLEKQKQVADKYESVTKEHASKIKEIKQNVSSQKRALDAQLAVMLREKTFHGFSNWLVATQMPAVLLPKGDR